MKILKQFTTTWDRLGVLLLILAGVAVLPFVKEEIEVSRAQSQFENKTSYGRLAGKTVAQVRSLLGDPVNADGLGNAMLTAGAGTDIGMSYRGPYREYCLVEIRGGVVTNVTYSKE